MLTASIGDFDFPSECQQTDTAVTCRHGMRNITGQRGDIAYLWATNNTTTFHQAGAKTDDGFLVNNPCVGDRATNDNTVVFLVNTVQTVYVGGIHHRFHDRTLTLLYFKQKIGSTTDYPGTPFVVLQQLNRLVYRVRCVVVFPANPDMRSSCHKPGSRA